MRPARRTPLRVREGSGSSAAPVTASAAERRPRGHQFARHLHHHESCGGENQRACCVSEGNPCDDGLRRSPAARATASARAARLGTPASSSTAESSSRSPSPTRAGVSAPAEPRSVRAPRLRRPPRPHVRGHRARRRRPGGRRVRSRQRRRQRRSPPRLRNAPRPGDQDRRRAADADLSVLDQRLRREALPR